MKLLCKYLILFHKILQLQKNKLSNDKKKIYQKMQGKAELLYLNI